MTKFIARFSDHIEEDIKRGWSSWNFGEEGIEGSEEDIERMKTEAVESDSPFYISGFELWGDDIMDADIRELYDGYWVLVDNTNGWGGDGIFGVELDALELEEAIEEAKDAHYFGEGVKFDPEYYELVHSMGGIHIFKEI